MDLLRTETCAAPTTLATPKTNLSQDSRPGLNDFALRAVVKKAKKVLTSLDLSNTMRMNVYNKAGRQEIGNRSQDPEQLHCGWEGARSKSHQARQLCRARLDRGRN